MASNDKAYCWGKNDAGQLGMGTNSPTRFTTPTDVYAEPGILQGVKVTSVSAGANRGCAVVENGRTYCWGVNSVGQIGDGTTVDRYKPTEALFLRPTYSKYIY